jgi:hypothetical protein
MRPNPRWEEVPRLRDAPTALWARGRQGPSVVRALLEGAPRGHRRRVPAVRGLQRAAAELRHGKRKAQALVQALRTVARVALDVKVMSSDTTLYISLVVLYTICTGRHQNDFNVHA